MTTLRETGNASRADLREIRFALWEQLRLDDAFPLSGYEQFSQEVVDEFLESAHEFAGTVLSPGYQFADREGCELETGGRVRTPGGYRLAWRRFVEQGWPKLGQSVEAGGLAAPDVVCQAINELLFGADPSFMIYSGFCVPVCKLIETYGSPHMKRLFCQRLAQAKWTACLCMTEADAGTDLALVRTNARPIGDGQFVVSGEKIFVSGGAHDLAENIVYVVLARAEKAPRGLRGLSLFIVPHLWMNHDGDLQDNGVQCVRLEDKMGLRGSSTVGLHFGGVKETRGYLLGEELNQGMLQLRSVMTQARISTAVYALGLASKAFRRASDYAHQRVQGTRAGQAINPRATRVKIAEHADVHRMLLEMQAKVEGSRALILRLSWYRTLVEASSAECERADKERWEALAGLLTPIAKAYVSDQAWRVCELAIQVHGGVGYLKDYPVEQCARDVKILSIWEGTNYIQAVDLLHARLGVARPSGVLQLLQEEVQTTKERLELVGFSSEARMLKAAIEAIIRAFGVLKHHVSEKNFNEVHAYATRFLEGMAETVFAWLLLEGAMAAKSALERPESCVEDVGFYQRKIEGATYFTLNILPGALMKAQIIETSLQVNTEAECEICDEV